MLVSLVDEGVEQLRNRSCQQTPYVQTTRPRRRNRPFTSVHASIMLVFAFLTVPMSGKCRLLCWGSALVGGAGAHRHIPLVNDHSAIFNKSLLSI